MQIASYSSFPLPCHITIPKYGAVSYFKWLPMFVRIEISLNQQCISSNSAMANYYEPPASGNRRDAVKGYNSGSFDDSAGDQSQTNDYQLKIKKSKSVPNADHAASRSWSFSDPESRRKRRVAGYKVYSVEQKMKGSIRKSFKWFKDIIGISWYTFSQLS